MRRREREARFSGVHYRGLRYDIIRATPTFSGADYVTSLDKEK
jgi:hypothetical protein